MVTSGPTNPLDFWTILEMVSESESAKKLFPVLSTASHDHRYTRLSFTYALVSHHVVLIRVSIIVLYHHLCFQSTVAVLVGKSALSLNALKNTSSFHITNWLQNITQTSYPAYGVSSNFSIFLYFSSPYSLPMIYFFSILQGDICMVLSSPLALVYLVEYQTLKSSPPGDIISNLLRSIVLLTESIL